MEICRHDPEFERVVTKLRAMYYDRHNDSCGKLKAAPIERYRWLMENYPELLTRLPVAILCKYLDIKEGALRKIMKEIREGRRGRKE